MYQSLKLFVPSLSYEREDLQVGQVDKKWPREEILVREIVEIGAQSSEG